MWRGRASAFQHVSTNTTMSIAICAATRHDVHCGRAGAGRTGTAYITMRMFGFFVTMHIRRYGE